MGAAERIYREDGFQNKNGATRNVRRQMRPTLRAVETTTPTVTQAGSAPSTDEQFTAQYAKAGVGKAANDNSYKPPRQPEARDAGAVYEPAVRSIARPNKLKIKKELKSRSLVKKTKAHIRAANTNIGIWSWGTYSWAFFQLPFALLSLAFFGLAGAVDYLTKLIETARAENKLIDIAGAGVEVIGSGLSFLNYLITSVTGYNLGNIITNLTDPLNYFLVTYAILLAYGLFTLIAIYLIYTIRFLKPLSGKGGGLKMGMFLLALIGYSVPILNLFPWFFPWTFAVLWKPK